MIWLITISIIILSIEVSPNFTNVFATSLFQRALLRGDMALSSPIVPKAFAVIDASPFLEVVSDDLK